MTLSLAEFLTITGMIGALIAAVITCTWVLAHKLNTYVTHSVCKNRMERHEKDIDDLKRQINPYPKHYRRQNNEKTN